MAQLELFGRELHRERDCPKGLTYRHWSEIIDLVCVRGCVPFDEDSVLADIKRCVPITRSTLNQLEDLDEVDATAWRWHWERHRPDLVRKYMEKTQ